MRVSAVNGATQESRIGGDTQELPNRDTGSRPGIALDQSVSQSMTLSMDASHGLGQNRPDTVNSGATHRPARCKRHGLLPDRGRRYPVHREACAYWKR